MSKILKLKEIKAIFYLREQFESKLEEINFALEKRVIGSEAERDVLTIMRNTLIGGIEDIDGYLSKFGCYFKK